MKKILALTLALVMLFSMASCMKSGFEGAEKEYNFDNLTITLTENFVESSYEGYTACFDSANVAVFCLKEAFSLAEGIEDWTLDQYAELTKQANADRSPTLRDVDGMPVMEYSFYNEDYDITYKYFSALYKTNDAFWMIQFACNEAIYDEHVATFEKWAKSVSYSTTTAE